MNTDVGCWGVSASWSLHAKALKTQVGRNRLAVVRISIISDGLQGRARDLMPLRLHWARTVHLLFTPIKQTSIKS
jgi:hypothetical protein